MFMIHLPPHVRIGDTADVRINKQPARVTWRDAQTLVVEPGDARRIVQILKEPDMNTFICADADGSADFHITSDRARRKP
jgi:hypothetical protein